MSAPEREVLSTLELAEHLERTLTVVTDVSTERSTEQHIDTAIDGWGIAHAAHYLNLWRAQAEQMARGAGMVLLPGPPERHEHGSAVLYSWPIGAAP